MYESSHNPNGKKLFAVMRVAEKERLSNGNYYKMDTTKAMSFPYGNKKCPYCICITY